MSFNNRGPLPEASAALCFTVLFEEELGNCCDVVTAIHPSVSSARIHGLVLDSSVLEVLLELERRLVEEV